MFRAILILLFFSNFCFAGGGYYLGGQTVTGDSCSNLGNYELYFDVDHTTGTTTACKPAGTETVSFNGGGASSDQNNTDGGTYSFKYDAADESIQITNNSYLNSAEGYVKFSLYCSASTGDNAWQIFEFRTDSQNRIYLYRTTTGVGTLYIEYRGNNSSRLYGYTVSLNESAWNTIEARWKLSNNEVGLQVNSGGWQTDTTGLTAFAGNDPSTIYFGEVSVGTSPAAALYIDDIYLSSTYAP